MPIKILNDKGDFIVQVQRAGQRRTQRGTGGEKEARIVEARLLAEITSELDKKKAAHLLGFVNPPESSSDVGKLPPTLRDFFVNRLIGVKHFFRSTTRKIAESSQVENLSF